MSNKSLLKCFVFQEHENFQIGDKDYLFQTREAGRTDTIYGLAKFNVIVGSNNSGKSRILRRIFEQKDLMKPDLAKDLVELFLELDGFISGSRTVVSYGKLGKTIELIKEIKRLQSIKFFSFKNDLVNNINNVKDEIEKTITDPNPFYRSNEGEILLKLREWLVKSRKIHEEISRKATEYHTLYIPTLRGMRPLENQDFYYIRTVQDYFDSDELDSLNDRKKIFTGYKIFADLKEKLLGTQSDRDFIRKYENFLSENFFNDVAVTLIPQQSEVNGKNNDVVYITFNNNEEEERAIYNLGDGLQTIIAITYPLFSWVAENEVDDLAYLIACIEEPELYLHPSMQRKLVEVLMGGKFKKVQFIVTTHSNHFLDLINEPEFQKKISIYGVQYINGTKYVKQENDLSNTVYKVLGARPSSMLLANKTIWVEGVSDRIYLRHGLKLYFDSDEASDSKKYSEYIDYAFIEYAGTNLAHYFEKSKKEDLRINSISNLKSVFLLVDDDGVKKGRKFERYEKAKALLGKRFKRTDGREIENYLSPRVLKAIYPDEIGDKNLPHYDSYKSKKLPKFLNDEFEIKKHISTQGKTKIFSDKQEFALRAIEHQANWEDLTADMQELIRTIAKFLGE